VAALLEADEILALSLLLAVTLVFVSKITTAQAEIERIVKMDEQPQNRAHCDVLTGLPNRAQFLERLTRVVQYVNYNLDFPVCHYVHRSRWL
jgi:GGDEF domain-containing protein